MIMGWRLRPIQATQVRSVPAESQTDRIGSEMTVAELSQHQLAAARSNPNFMLRKRRPDLYGKLLTPITSD